MADNPPVCEMCHERPALRNGSNGYKRRCWPCSKQNRQQQGRGARDTQLMKCWLQSLQAKGLTTNEIIDTLWSAHGR